MHKQNLISKYLNGVLVSAGLIIQGTAIATSKTPQSFTKPAPAKITSPAPPRSQAPKSVSKPASVPKTEQQKQQHQRQHLQAKQRAIREATPKGKDGKPIQRYVSGQPLTGNRKVKGTVQETRVNIKYRGGNVAYDNGKPHGKIKGDHIHLRDRTRPPGKTFSRQGKDPNLVKNLSPKDQSKPFTKVIPANKESTRLVTRFLAKKEKMLKQVSKQAKSQFRQKAKPKGGRK